MASVKGAAEPNSIELDPATRSLLEEIARAQSLPHRDVVRARLILLVAEGHSVTEIAASQVLRQSPIARYSAGSVIVITGRTTLTEPDAFVDLVVVVGVVVGVNVDFDGATWTWSASVDARHEPPRRLNVDKQSC
jgi:hypothetical protein